MWHPDGPRAHARCARATSAAVGFTQHFTNLAADEPGINENSHHISRLQLAADGESIEGMICEAVPGTQIAINCIRALTAVVAHAGRFKARFISNHIKHAR